MRRTVVWLIVTGLVLGLSAPAWAGWTWRNGRWEYSDDRAPPTPPAPGEPKPPQAPPAPPIPPTPGAEQPSPAPAPAPAPPPEAPPAPKIETPSAPKPEVPPVPPPAAPKAEVPAPTPPPQENAPAAQDSSSAKTPWWKWWAKPPSADTSKSWWQSWWSWGDTVQPDADRLLFEEGKSYMASGYPRMADWTFRRLIKGYPTSAFREEAMWLRAESLMAQKEHFNAFYQYDELVTQYAGSPHYADALRREIEIAEILLGPERRRVLGIPMTSGDSEAIEILHKVYEHQPTGDLADAVVLRTADHYFAKQQWAEAEENYDKFCREYPNSDGAIRAELQRAKCTIEKCRGARYDTAGLQLAYDRLRQFQAKFPEAAEKEGVGALLAKVRERQAEGLYEIAARYRRGGQPLAAAFYAERLRERFPDTTWSEKAREFLAQAPLKEQEPPK